MLEEEERIFLPQFPGESAWGSRASELLTVANFCRNVGR